MRTGADEDTFLWPSPMAVAWLSAYSVHVLLSLKDPSAGAALGVAGMGSLLVANGTKKMGTGSRGYLSTLLLSLELLMLLFKISGDGYAAALTVSGCAGGVDATGAGGRPGGAPGKPDGALATFVPELGCEAGVEDPGLFRFVGVKGAAPTDSGFAGEEEPLLGVAALDPSGGGRPPTTAFVGVRGAADADMGLGT